MRMTNIKSICYQLYVMSWEEKNKTVSSFREYCEYCLENNIERFSYDDYLLEINGELYCSLPEFLHYEYQDKEYIKELLSSDILYSEYLKDISEKNEVTLSPTEAKEFFEYYAAHLDSDYNYIGSKTIPSKIVVNGNLNYLNIFKCFYLPDNITINGDLNLSGTHIKELPNNLSVAGSLIMECTKITKLPDNLRFNGDLILNRCLCLKELPNNLFVNGDLYLNDTNIEELPENITVKGNMFSKYTQFTKLPKHLLVDGNLLLSHTQITELPEELVVKGNLELRCTSITELPRNMVVKGTIYCDQPFKIRS